MDRATRDAFGDQLILSGTDENVLVLNADLGKATKTNGFGEKYPERFFEVGIAENNMIGIASGLSEYGYRVFLSSFASFLTGKYDTIRVSLSYSNAPVVLVGTHGGLAIGRDGVTQMGLEDVSLMRSLPGMVVLNPATYRECLSVVKYLCEEDLHSTHYLRLGRQPVGEFFNDDYKFEVGRIDLLKSGSSAVVLSTGCILADVMKATEGLDVTVLNVTTLKPFDGGVVNLLKQYGHIFTVEDHSIVGGLGSIVSEVLSEGVVQSKLIRIGIEDVFPESGDPKDLYDKYGLSSRRIRERIINGMS